MNSSHYGHFDKSIKHHSDKNTKNLNSKIQRFGVLRRNTDIQPSTRKKNEGLKRKFGHS